METPEVMEMHDSPNTHFVRFMEAIVVVVSLLRIGVVGSVFWLNVAALRKQTPYKCACLRGFVADSVKLVSIVYILSWVPFLIYSLCNGKWLWMNATAFCIAQNFVTNSTSMILLAFMVCMVIERVYMQFRNDRRPLPYRYAALLTITAWVWPQLGYYVLAVLWQKNSNDTEDWGFNFFEDLFDSSEKPCLQGISYKIGFTICGQKMSGFALSQYVYQYSFLILPMGLVIGLGMLTVMLRQMYRRNYKPLNTVSSLSLDCLHCPTTCKTDSPGLVILLATNTVWQLLIKPLVIIIWWQSPWNLKDHAYLDIGSHIMLTIVAIFGPIRPSRSSSSPSSSKTILP